MFNPINLSYSHLFSFCENVVYSKKWMDEQGMCEKQGSQSVFSYLQPAVKPNCRAVQLVNILRSDIGLRNYSYSEIATDSKVVVDKKG